MYVIFQVKIGEEISKEYVKYDLILKSAICQAYLWTKGSYLFFAERLLTDDVLSEKYKYI